MRKGNETGQALVETLLVVPVFLLLGVGLLVVGSHLRARARAEAWARSATYSPAGVSGEERARAGWSLRSPSVEAELRARLAAHAKGDERGRGSGPERRAREQRRIRQTGRCGADGPPASFCYGDLYDLPRDTWRDASAMLPRGWAKELERARRMESRIERPLGTLAVTPWDERGRRVAKGLLAGRAASLASSSPARRRPLLDSSWNGNEGFHLDVWLGTEAATQEDVALEHVYVLVAKKARSGQLALCALESSKTYFAGALFEAISTMSAENGEAGAGCQNVARIAKGVEKAVDGILRARALEILARETCADAAALADGSGPCTAPGLDPALGKLTKSLGDSNEFADFASAPRR